MSLLNFLKKNIIQIRLKIFKINFEDLQKERKSKKKD